MSTLLSVVRLNFFTGRLIFKAMTLYCFICAASILVALSFVKLKPLFHSCLNCPQMIPLHSVELSIISILSKLLQNIYSQTYAISTPYFILCLHYSFPSSFEIPSKFLNSIPLNRCKDIANSIIDSKCDLKIRSLAQVKS